MLMIGREAINSVMSLKGDIADPAKRRACIARIDNMIAMKESHLARAEWGSCCGSICTLAPQIDSELQMLRNVLEALRSGDSAKASSLLDDYVAFLHRNYAPEPEHW